MNHERSKFTQKSLEAVQRAQELTLSHENQQWSKSICWGALLEQDQGLIPQLLQKMNKDVDALNRRVAQEIDRLPAVRAPAGRPAASMFPRRWTGY